MVSYITREKEKEYDQVRPISTRYRRSRREDWWCRRRKSRASGRGHQGYLKANPPAICGYPGKSGLSKFVFGVERM
jgi:hypothetical protein